MTSATPDPALAESYRILRSRLDLSRLPPLSRAVTEHVICATADFEYVTDLVCDELALASGLAALRRGAAVVADGPTVAAGISGYPVICKAGDSLAGGWPAPRTSPSARPGSGWPSPPPGPVRSGWPAARRTRWLRLWPGRSSPPW